mmetsp:Transcript_1172/g.3757  ORF Transcript_1172/g.3757 Transcript_1172/m.3757 type:complete len:227 (-) Transcript_1172:445-1125(-)
MPCPPSPCSSPLGYAPSSRDARTPAQTASSFPSADLHRPRPRARSHRLQPLQSSVRRSPRSSRHPPRPSSASPCFPAPRCPVAPPSPPPSWSSCHRTSPSPAHSSTPSQTRRSIPPYRPRCPAAPSRSPQSTPPAATPSPDASASPCSGTPWPARTCTFPRSSHPPYSGPISRTERCSASTTRTEASSRRRIWQTRPSAGGCPTTAPALTETRQSPSPPPRRPHPE